MFHSDIKPDNILVSDADGVAILIDFGISAIMRTTAAANAGGTVPYMAPEALSGKAAFRADIWSLSVTLYELVTGRLPFPLPPRNVAQGVEAIKVAILHEDPIPPNKHNPKIGERLNGTTMRSRTLSAVLALFAALPIGAQLIPRDSEFHVKLLAPIDTKTSRKRDKITAQVLAPVALQARHPGRQDRRSQQRWQAQRQGRSSFHLSVLEPSWPRDSSAIRGEVRHQFEGQAERR